MSKNVFSIDVEDWYQGIGIPISDWDRYEKRVDRSMDTLLELMSLHEVRSTCFILGKTADEHPALVKRIQANGHEIATHGYSHELVYRMNPVSFRADLRKSIDILQNLTGNQVIGYRAPYFSITSESLWALDILAEEGIRYDSSIHPVMNWRYGIPSAERTAKSISTPSGYGLLEIPVSTYPYPFFNLPVGGGAYFRIYRYGFIDFHLKRLLEKDGYINFYIQPWELDPLHPRLKLPLRISVTHYHNLDTTYYKLDTLFKDYTFTDYSTAFRTDIFAQ